METFFKEGFLSRQVNIAADTTLQIEVSIFVTGQSDLGGLVWCRDFILGLESEDAKDLGLFEWSLEKISIFYEK